MWHTTRLYIELIFFLVYVNDLAFACKQARPVLLADRSRVNISSIDVDNVQQVKNESTKIYIHGLEKMKMSAKFFLFLIKKLNAEWYSWMPELKLLSNQQHVHQKTKSLLSSSGPN